jgi:hypothetical protein
MKNVNWIFNQFLYEHPKLFTGIIQLFKIYIILISLNLFTWKIGYNIGKPSGGL